MDGITERNRKKVNNDKSKPVKIVKNNRKLSKTVENWKKVTPSAMFSMKKICIPIFLILVILNYITALQPSAPCLPKYGYCVCTNNYCDTLDIREPSPKEYAFISTSMSSMPFGYINGKWSASRGFANASVTYLEVDQRKPYEDSTITGFGGSFTDFDAKILQRLSPNLRECLLKSYFAEEGLNYDLLRVPISNASDFQRKLYLTDLIDFIANKKLRISVAIRLTDQNRNSRTLVNSHTKLVDFVRENKVNKVWSISLEPSRSTPLKIADQAAYMDFLRANLNGTKSTSKGSNRKVFGPKIAVTDITQDIGNLWLEQLTKIQKNALNQIDMIYISSSSIPSERLYRANKKYQKPILFTRTDYFSNPKKLLGKWQRAEELASTLISLLQRNVNGYIESTLISFANTMFYATFGGDPFISVDEHFSRINKQPAFYAMAHFSKYILAGSKRIDAILCGSESPAIQTVAYLRPDTKVAVILHNTAKQRIQLVLIDKSQGEVKIVLEPKSINTMLY